MTNQDMSDDGEIVEGEILEPVDAGAMVKIARTEIDAQIATAKAYPRNVTKLRQELQALVTIDEDTAEECIYALPRGNKFIKGPSARFADALICFWGNARSGAYVTDVNREEGYVEAIGSFQDVERNVIRQRRVRRGIKTARGQIYNSDMINMTGNAACVIAERNAILNGIPKSLWGPVYDRAFAVVAGGTQSLGDKIGRAKKALMAMGIGFDQVLERLGYGTDESRITPEDVVTLRGMLTALKTGEETPESLFGRGAGAGPAHETVKNPLKDDPISSGPEANVQRQTATSQNAGGAKREQTESSGSVRDERHPQEDGMRRTQETMERSGPASTQGGKSNTADEDHGEPAEHDADGVVHDTGPVENNAQPAGAGGSSAGSKPDAPAKNYSDAETYIAFMQDQIDSAGSKAAVTEAWGATRSDRSELLAAPQIEALTKYKEAKLQKLKKGDA